MSKKSPSKSKPALLIYADTRKSADQLYFGGFSVPDAFVSFRIGRKSYALLNQLEFGRGKKESNFDVVLPFEEWVEKARAAKGRTSVGIVDIIEMIASDYRVSEFQVPGEFPASVAFGLVERGLKIHPVTGSIFPQREIKTEEELGFIREGNRCSARGIRAAENVLKEATVKKGSLYLRGKPLTSERLREAIEVACLEAGSVSADTIAAGGDQACDPHCAGHGPLRANELIIVDVFPRVSRTGYHGDMTRTFLKGQASDAQKHLVASVRAAQKRALSMVKAGIDGQAIHAAVNENFADDGYETKRDGNGAVGFFHGTGHGLGLEIHESPRVSTVSNTLKKNMAITIEPGLYYPGLGGCRIEDVVAVRKDGSEKLSSYHYRWEIA